MRFLKKCVFLCLGFGDEEMEIYDNDEEGDDDSDDGIEVEDDDDGNDEKEEFMLLVNGVGFSIGIVVFSIFYSCFCRMLCFGLFVINIIFFI